MSAEDRYKPDVPSPGLNGWQRVGESSTSLPPRDHFITRAHQETRVVCLDIRSDAPCGYVSLMTAADAQRLAEQLMQAAQAATGATESHSCPRKLPFEGADP